MNDDLIKLNENLNEYYSGQRILLHLANINAFIEGCIHHHNLSNDLVKELKYVQNSFHGLLDFIAKNDSRICPDIQPELGTEMIKSLAEEEEAMKPIGMHLCDTDISDIHEDFHPFLEKVMTGNLSKEHLVKILEQCEYLRSNNGTPKELCDFVEELTGEKI